MQNCTHFGGVMNKNEKSDSAKYVGSLLKLMVFMVYRKPYVNDIKQKEPHITH